MQKRRERIERWRADRKRKEIDQAKKEVQKGSIVTSIQLPISKKWSLEDDSGDEGVLGKHILINCYSAPRRGKFTAALSFHLTGYYIKSQGPF